MSIREFSSPRTKRERKKQQQQQQRSEQCLDLWDSMKHTNICILRIPEGEEREDGAAKIFKKLITPNFPNLIKNIALYIQEAQQTSSKLK